jgi:hypothetical protein
MGPAGTVESAREFLACIKLTRFAHRSELAFMRELDRATDEMLKALPSGARHWGMARKLLNIFLRGATYNRFLCEAYGLSKADPWLEVPLDSHVAKGLRGEKAAGLECGKNGKDILPHWKTVIGLDQIVSKQYQAFANDVAQRDGIHRVHLDLRYWRQLGQEPANGPTTSGR